MEVEYKFDYKGEQIAFDPLTQRFRWRNHTAASIEQLEKMIDRDKRITKLENEK